MLHAHSRCFFKQQVLKKNNFIYVFTYGCVGSSLLGGLLFSYSKWGLLLLHRAGFSSQWLLLLPSTGSRVCGLQQLRHTGSVVVAPKLQSTGSRVVVHRLSCSKAYGIFPDQRQNLCLLHWHADSLPLSHQGSPVGAFYMIVNKCKAYFPPNHPLI